MQAKDKVTGYSGVVTTISFDLYGCVQAVITPPAAKDVKIDSGHWFDVTRLELSDQPKVMETPDFDEGYIAEGKKGCANKPLPNN